MEDNAPADFYCPILQTVMVDPVCTADGHTYERSAIEEWLRPGRMTSPNTNLRLSTAALTPNHALRSAIEEWRGRSQQRAAQELTTADLLFAVGLREKDLLDDKSATRRLEVENAELRSQIDFLSAQRGRQRSTHPQPHPCHSSEILIRWDSVIFLLRPHSSRGTAQLSHNVLAPHPELPVSSLALYDIATAEQTCPSACGCPRPITHVLSHPLETRLAESARV